MLAVVESYDGKRAVKSRTKSAKRQPVRRAKAARSAWTETSPHLVDAERLAARFIEQLEAGDHAFRELRGSFAEWCDAGDLAPVSDMALAKWLKDAGLEKFRAGAKKITIYRKAAARYAARNPARYVA